MSQKSRKMTIALTPGSIGVKATQAEAIELAHYYGYESVEPFATYLSTLSESEIRKTADHVQSLSLQWAAAGLPVEFRQSEEQFQEGLKMLPKHARALQVAGVTRVGTWIRPTHDTLTYRQNFDQHVRRLGAVAQILEDHGLRLGLEYVGPKLSWSAQRYPFIHTLAETKELIAALGRKNVGFVLDSWHWYTAKESVADLETLSNAQVVSVDLNDAPRGLSIDQQVDNQRELPCATGVIDVGAFLNALYRMEYDGPVRPEPFNAALRQLPKDQILSTTLEAMQKAFALIKS
ncbi:MAG: sugar phosphate isomerase/epimerase [Bryobacteraceae bacterium]|nr:sugar phosphate isomerase/epimerase [Bryobacteraceae bacterium]MDW8378704.1 TIM barrel protein [Bryobacterales bacterium]